MAAPIKETDVVEEFQRVGGPGGQNRNRRETGVRLTHLPTGLVATAYERRVQSQNRSLAWERLQEKVDKYFHKDKKRVKTKATRGSKERRLKEKSHRKTIKSFRRGDE